MGRGPLPNAEGVLHSMGGPGPRAPAGEFADEVRRLRAALQQREPSLFSLRPGEGSTGDFAQAVADGLGAPHRRIPSRFLYDRVGSALFERICELPEYYLTRTEAAILARGARFVRARTGPVNLVELGAGSSQKASLLLAAALERGDLPHYLAIDVCEPALRHGQRELGRRLPSVVSVGLHGRFEQALPLLSAASPVMVLFLGSTIGNCSPEEAAALLGGLFRELSPGDYLLLGVDLVKEARLLREAYQDASGTTAAFTLNLFARMNRELGADLDLATIEHQAAWVPERQRVEIHACFRSAQTLRVAPLERSFAIAPGERILTEISRKYRLEELPRWLGRFGFEVQEVLRDERDWFALVLARKGAELPR